MQTLAEKPKTDAEIAEEQRIKGLIAQVVCDNDITDRSKIDALYQIVTQEKEQSFNDGRTDALENEDLAAIMRDRMR
jgi:hypothetical protein